MALDSNTQALLSGYQIGNVWATNQRENRRDKLETAYRNRQSKEKLEAHFGDDTVYDDNGEVDIVGSAAKQRLRANTEAMEAAQGFRTAYDSIKLPSFGPEPGVAPPPAPFVAPSGEETPYRAPVMGDVPDPETGEIHPTLRRVVPPVAQPAAFAAPQGAMGMSRTNFFAPPPQAAPQAVEALRQAPVQAAAPVIASTPRAVLPPDAVRIPPSVSMPDMAGWSPARTRGFVSTYPKALEEQRKAIHDATVAQTQLEVMKQSAETRRYIADQGNLTKKDVTDMITERQKFLQDSKEEAALKIQQLKGEQALTKMGLSPVRLEKSDETEAKAFAATFANKQTASRLLDNALETIKNPAIPFDVRIATAKNTFKTLNSADYKSDAVSGAEEKRIGGLLGFEWNPIKGFIEVGHIAPDLPGFIKQVEIKTSDLKEESEALRDDIRKVYRKYGVDIDNPRGLLTPDPAKAGSEPNRIRVNSQAEYDRLAPGTPYVDSNGKAARKPAK